MEDQRIKDKILVHKRNGSFEEFQTQKIARVVQAAGLDRNKANILAEVVARWVSGFGQNTITSLEIRDKVIEEIEKVNQYAANLFKWYQKSKDSENHFK